MKKQAIADLPAIQRRDREALEIADREGITFAEAWARPARAAQYPGGAGQGWDSFSSYFGCWPGDETDDQWNEMMLELKK